MPTTTKWGRFERNSVFPTGAPREVLVFASGRRETPSSREAQFPLHQAGEDRPGSAASSASGKVKKMLNGEKNAVNFDGFLLNCVLFFFVGVGQNQEKWNEKFGRSGTLFSRQKLKFRKQTFSFFLLGGYILGKIRC